MSASDAPDAPTYRGKTLSPASPRPVHIPEPANIPVLQNQIDPVFNLMSTHMSVPQSARNMTAMDQQITEQSANAALESQGTEINNQEIMDNSMDAGEDGGTDTSGQTEDATTAKESGEANQAHTQSSIVHDQASALTHQSAAPAASHDVLPTTPSNPSAQAPTHPQPTEAQEANGVPQPAQDAPQNDSQQAPASEQEATQVEGGNDVNMTAPASGEVNYQALLDNIVPSTAADDMVLDTVAGNQVADETSGDVPTPSSANLPTQSLPSAASLPPRPPPQEKPAIHPNYVPGEDIRSYHYPHLNTNTGGTSSGLATQSPQQSNAFHAQPSFPNNASTGSNGLPPPPMASFQQPVQTGGEQVTNPPQQQSQPQQNRGGQRDAQGRRQNKGARNDEGPWAPEVQQLYDQFLDDEAVYTAEGTWDKFPQGSRLFVGNLPTEIVTKRDIFHIFYRYGRLAQISIKQAYGFVQFMDTASSHEALRCEQNGKIKDRNMHLEISKPPKNTRNAQPTAAGERLRAGHYRRSRSPDRRQGSRDIGRAGDTFRGGRDEPRRRDDYRPRRSPSPRGFRARDSYRGGRSPDRYDGGRDRSRSPPYGRSRYDRTSSPDRHRGFGDDDGLPRKRDLRDVPEVQIIIMENLDSAFISFLEKHFRDSGLKLAVMAMPPRVSIEALIKQHVFEGVQAIVCLSRSSQLTGRVPVQIFDRSGGGAQARFENYENLEAQVAVAVINRNKQKQPPLVPPTPFAVPTPAYGAPMAGQPANPQHPNLPSIFTQLDPATLQKVVSALQSHPQTPQTAVQSALQSPTQNPDLAALLASAGHMPNAAQMQPRPGYPYQQQPQMPPQQQQPQHQQQQPPQQQQYPGYGMYPQGGMPQQPAQQQQPMAQQHYQQYQSAGGAQPQPQAQPQPNQVQDIMQQLAKYRQ